MQSRWKEAESAECHPFVRGRDGAVKGEGEVRRKRGPVETEGEMGDDQQRVVCSF